MGPVRASEDKNLLSIGRLAQMDMPAAGMRGCRRAGSRPEESARGA